MPLLDWRRKKNLFRSVHNPQLPRILLIFFSLAFLISNSKSSLTKAPPNLLPSQYNALYEFYNVTHGPYWIWNNLTSATTKTIPWDFQQANPNPCNDNWQGIECACPSVKGTGGGSGYCNLTSLSLAFHNITGPFSNSFSALYTLENLDLSFNDLSQTIPEQIFTVEWKYLLNLDLSWNLLTGNIPNSISQLINLEALTLSRNYLNYLPNEEIVKLKVLRTLQLDGNLFHQPLPEDFGNMSSLQRIFLSFNGFSSTLPVSVSQLQNLEVFVVSNNLLTRSLPAEYGNLSNLLRFEVDRNELSGTLPLSYSKLVNLRHLSFEKNNIFGSFPDSYHLLTELRFLYCDYNLLSGSVPPSFKSLKRLLFLDIGPNSLTGNVNFVAHLSNVSVFYCPENFLVGNFSLIPVTNFNHILDLATLQNQFTGILPFSVVSNASSEYPFFINSTRFDLNTSIYAALNYYFVQNNYFTGTISLDYKFYKDLRYFSISENFLSGSLPSYLFGMKSMETLNISMNLITGTIPTVNQTRNDTKLYQFLVFNNYLTGTIPISLSTFSNLIALSLHHNRLISTVPNEVGSLRFLEQLFIQNNDLTGSITVLLNSTLSNIKALRNLDFSNNRFTGYLDEKYFEKSIILETFAAVSNCITGTIPQSICTLEFLTALALDGLSSSASCRNNIFPDNNPFKFNGFLLRSHLSGNIPDCLFAMRNLESLHLSGNLFSGTLSNSLNISHSLDDLTLSHNLFSGTIPRTIQERSWVNLDLSYNKFGGTLSSNFAEYPGSNHSLSLQVNRLSGKVPKSLLSTQTINLLDGNIFSCTVNKYDELPSHDPNVNSYSCGSNTVDNILFSWIAIVMILLIVFVLRVSNWHHIFRLKEQEELPKLSMDSHASFNSVHVARKSFSASYALFIANNPRSNISLLFKLLRQMRRIFLLLALYSVVIMLPIFSALKQYYKSYDNEYAWIISGILLSGKTPALVLFTFLLILIVSLYLLFTKFIYLEIQVQKEPELTRMESEKETLEIFLSGSFKFIIYFFVVVFNLIIFGSFDFIYVLITLNYSTLAIICAAIALALFRIVTNNLLMRRGLPSSSKLWIFLYFHLFCRSNEPLKAQFNDFQQKKLFWKLPYIYKQSDTAFLGFLVLLNNVVVPVLAIFVILPDCYYNAFYAAAEVVSSYSYINCDFYILNGILEAFCVPSSQQTNYLPPFIYSFQCSSKIIINYIPVYIMTFILSGFGIPLKDFLLKLWHNYLISKPKSGNGWTETMVTLLERMMSFRLVFPNIDMDKMNTHQVILFDRLKFSGQISSFLAVVIIYGTLFPPLAIIGCFTLFIMIYYEELMLGKLLFYSFRKSEYNWIRDHLEREVHNIHETLYLCMKILLYLPALSFAYLLFDIWGDEEGWETALPISICFLFIPVILNLGYAFLNRASTRWNRTISLADQEYGMEIVAIQNPITKSNSSSNNSPPYSPKSDDELKE